MIAVTRVRSALVGAALLAASPLPFGPSLALVGPAAAQVADVTLENVRLGFGSGSYTAPRVIIRGSTLSQAEWSRLLDPAAPDALPDRVVRMQARTIEIPELVSEVAMPQLTQRTTYRDVRIVDLAGGRIGSVAAENGAFAPSSTQGGEGRFGRMAVEGLDLGRSIALLHDKARPDDAFRMLYGSFSVADLTLDDGQGMRTRIGRMAGRDFAAKPTGAGWLGTIDALAARPDIKAGTPEQRRAGTAALVEIFDAVSFGSLEMADVSFAPADRSLPGMRMDRVAFTGSAGGRPAELRLDGFEGGSPERGTVKIASLAFGGLSIRPVLDTMSEDLDKGPPPGPVAIRRLFASLGSLRVSGVEAEFPEGRSAPTDGLPGRSTRFSLGQFEMVTGRPVDGLPSDVKLSLSNVAVPIPANPTDDALKQVAALGYDRIDASVAVNFGWNEPGREIVLRELSIDGAGMGHAVLRGVVGNVTRDAFNPDTALASVALLGAAAKSAELTVENHGLFERIVGREARRQKRPAEDVRREYGVAAAVGIPALLGNSPAAKTLSQAVARFVAKPGRLVVRAAAKQPSGYGAADFASAPDPASILNALEIAATAE